jgi:hypothetical protein
MRNHGDDCGCNSCCERGPRGCDGPVGPEGPAGPAGRRGLSGSTGPTGPCCTGPTGPSSSSDGPLAAGFFHPDGQAATVTIVSQTGEFASATYLSLGNYRLRFVAIPGLTVPEQLIPVVSPRQAGFTAAVTPLDILGLLVDVIVRDAAGDFADSDFFVHVKLLLP